MTSLSDYTDDELLAELLRRRIQLNKHCICGVNRQEVVIAEDEVFAARKGCSRCNLWDELPKLKAKQ